MQSGAYDLGYLKYGITAVFVAYTIAFMLVTIVVAMTGQPRLETPLLVSLVAATATSLTVAVFMTRWLAGTTTPEPTTARNVASAMFTFSNAVGTLAGLVGQIFRALEIGMRSNELPDRDALGLMLEFAGFQGVDKLLLYLGICCTAGYLALRIIKAGARIFRDRRAEQSAAGAISLASIGLLIISILIGTPWQPAMSADEGLLLAKNIGATVAIGCTSIFAILLTAILLTFAAQTVAGLVSVGALSARSIEAHGRTLSFRARIFLEVMAGLFLAVIGFFVALSAFILFVDWIGDLGDFSSSQRELVTTRLASTVTITSAFFAVGSGLLILPLGAWLAFKGGIWSIGFGVKVWRRVATLISNGFEAFQRHFATVRERWTKARSRQRPLTAPDPLARAEPGRSLEKARNRQRHPIEAHTKAPVDTTVPSKAWKWERAALILICLVGGIAATRYFFERSHEVPDIETEITQLVDVQTTDVSPPIGYEFAKPWPVSPCAPPVGTLNWPLNVTDKLEVALDDCMLPEDVRTADDGVLVVVSVASFGPNSSSERQLALRRGTNIARWAYYRAPADMPIYVLNLGMALREDAFTVGWRQFGAVTGERPALAMLIRPFPEGTTVPPEDILLELNRNLSLERVKANFTDCELLKFEPTAGTEESLLRVPELTC